MSVLKLMGLKSDIEDYNRSIMVLRSYSDDYSKMLKTINDTRGVEKFIVDKKTGNVTVVGRMDPNKLWRTIEFKTGQQIELLSMEPYDDVYCNGLLIQLDSHCTDCDSEAIYIIRTFPGVKDVRFDSSNNIVIVGKVDFDKLKKEVESKVHYCRIFLISCHELTEKEKEKMYICVILSVEIHCNDCANSIERAIENKMGPVKVSCGNRTNVLIVSGTVEVDYLVRELKRMTGKNVRVLQVEKFECD